MRVPSKLLSFHRLSTTVGDDRVPAVEPCGTVFFLRTSLRHFRTIFRISFEPFFRTALNRTPQAAQHDPIADFIRDDLWPNPLKFFTGQVEEEEVWMNEEEEEEKDEYTRDDDEGDGEDEFLSEEEEGEVEEEEEIEIDDEDEDEDDEEEGYVELVEGGDDI